MTNILGTVKSGPQQMGQRMLIAGQEKSGKTTLACGAPRSLLVPLEIGYASFSNAKTPMLNSFDEVMGLINECGYACQRKQFPFQTIIFDSATALERLIHAKIISTDPKFAKGNQAGVNMEVAHGGYGKAYQLANEKFNDFTVLCDALAYNFGINIILTCHTFAARVNDPAYGEFDTWDLLLHSPKNNRNYGKREMMTQWVDFCGFLHEPILVLANDKQQMVRAVSANRGRVIGTDRTPGYVAGNRYRLTGEIPIPVDNGWNYLADAIYKASGVDLYNRDIK